MKFAYMYINIYMYIYILYEYRPVGVVEVQQTFWDAEKYSAQPNRTEPASSTKEEKKIAETHTVGKERGLQLGTSGRREGERAVLGRGCVTDDERCARDRESRETQKGGVEGGLRTEAKPSVAAGGSGGVREVETKGERPLHSTTPITGTATKIPGQRQYVCVHVYCLSLMCLNTFP